MPHPELPSLLWRLPISFPELGETTAHRGTFSKKLTFSLETFTTFPTCGNIVLTDLSNNDITRIPNFGQYVVGILYPEEQTNIRFARC